MCDNETFKIQCVTMRHLNTMCDTMRHLQYNVWQWDISNTMCDTMRQFGTFKIQCVTQWDILNYNVWHNETF